MPALVAGIYVLVPKGKGVDGRDKPGHDDRRRSSLLRVPQAQPGRGERAADHARNAELDLPDRGGRDAAERQRALADLAPERDVALVARALALELVDRGGRLLAQPRQVDRLGRLDHLVEARLDLLGV